MKTHLVFPEKNSLQTATDLVVVNGLEVHTIANSWNRSTLILAGRKYYRDDEFDAALLAKLQARLKPGNAEDRWEPY